MAAPKHLAHGIDLSRWDPQYNPRVRPVDFAIIKASEGSTWHDPKFAQHVDACNSAGMLVGAYHYYRSGIPWRAQLDNFLGATQGKELSKLMALDYEKINNTLTVATDRELYEFYRALIALGFVPIIYLSYNEYQLMLRRGASWIADPTTRVWVARWYSRQFYYNYATGPGVPQWESGICIWQYGGDYKDKTGWEVPGFGEAAAYGVTGKHSIDLNVYNNTIEKMRIEFEAPVAEIIEPDAPSDEAPGPRLSRDGWKERVRELMPRPR